MLAWRVSPVYRLAAWEGCTDRRAGGWQASTFLPWGGREVTPGEVRSTALYTRTATDTCKAARRTRNSTCF